MKNIIYTVLGLIVVVVTAVGGFLGWKGNKDATYSIGDKIENFSLSDVNGTQVSFAGIAGASGTIIIFTCNTCPYSKLYDERILQIEDVYRDAGYPVVIINPSDPVLKPGDQSSELIKWIDTHNFKGTYLIDNTRLHHRFGAEKTPEVFLLDKEMKLRYRGAIDNSAQGSQNVTKKYLENAIQALEKNQDPDPTVTKAVGCVIKSE